MPERIPQSVAIRVPLYAVLSSDGISPATGKTIAVTISKNGAAFGNPSAGATNATAIGSGWYYVDLSTTDTGTLGPLIVLGTEGTINNVTVAYNVVSATNGGLSNLDAAISSRSSHTAADVWAVATRVLTAGTNIALAKGTGVTGFNDLDAAGVRSAVGLASANLDTQLTTIDDFLDTEIAAIKAKTDQLTFGTANRVNAQVYGMEADVVTAAAIAADAIGSSELAATAVTEIQAGLSTLDAAGVRAAVGLASANLDTQLTTIDDFLDTEIAAIKAKTDQLTFSTANRVNAQVYGMEADVVTAAAIAADAIGSSELAATAVTEIQSGLATSAALTTAQADLDDIQTRLPAALVGGRMDASVGAMAANTLTASALATDAVTEIQSGLGAGLDAAGVRAAIGLASANLDAQLDALPTNAELTTALAGADDATLAAIAALPTPLDAAGVRGAVGLAAANLDTQLGDLPTNSELSTALAAADDAVLAQIALVKSKTDALSADPADASDIAAAFSTLATAVADVPTNAELATALNAADDAVLAAIADLQTHGDAAWITAVVNTDAVLTSANGVETGVTLQQALRIVLSAIAGKSSGFPGGPVRYRDVNDTTDRIVATVSEGNRSAVTLDAG